MWFSLESSLSADVSFYTYITFIYIRGGKIKKIGFATYQRVMILKSMITLMADSFLTFDLLYNQK